MPIYLGGIHIKVSRKMATWKHKSLSISGRVCLINSVLVSLPLFLMSFYKMLECVVKKIESLQRKFLWGRSERGK